MAYLFFIIFWMFSLFQYVKATNDSNQLRRARMWTHQFPRLTVAIWTHPTSKLLFKSMILRQDFTLWVQTLELWTHGSQKNQFNLMNQKFLTTANVLEDVTLSVREAAPLHSNTGVQGFFKCLCQTAYLTKKMQMHQGLLTTPWSNKVIQRNPFPFYSVIFYWFSKASFCVLGFK